MNPNIHSILDAMDAIEAAKYLLGAELIREIDGKLLRVRIVETEAYHQSDAASHSYHGRTPRTDVMFGSAGHLYVYFTYGMHYCCNVVVGREGYGAAVLLRAAEPLEGQTHMQQLRDKDGIALTNGPAKLCQALQIDKVLNGHDLAKNPCKLLLRDPLPLDQIVQTTRIGISKARDEPWRFYIRDNPYVSHT
ncbi:DNA-3-methyladenine glycosylase [Candidatus Mycosynbacter amalyticus]|uniref:Putative 3-methyladenine DNA glycosylase n=1 Tax=Candidatus Mycosynbacter amalyticus TaxID=2665156 RepID=A0A857MJC1_9BACT|nr:DNA-3-methyladenine glycosylase [Candidatus Mycosynbacter amalyticus]QHN42643.1 DNA-3-methyladenine glycosylase [Candidatus Mycosynbacter amalyticus]